MDNPFKNLLKKTEESVLGIDIGTSAIKVVQLRNKKGRAVLETYGELSLGPYAGLSIGQVTNLPPEKLSEAITDVLKEANTSTTNAGISIPFRSSLVTLMELPPVSSKKLDEMIPLEARKYIPVPISEVTLDWWVIPKESNIEIDDESKPEEEKHKTDVLVVSIHNEVLNSYNSIVKSANLNASFFEIEMFSAARSLLDQEPTASMIFDMGASSTKVYLVDHGVIKNSHIINKGSQDITQSISKGMNLPVARAEHIKRNLGDNTLKPEDQKGITEMISLTLDYIFSEANSVLLSFQKKYQKTVGKVILTGGGVAMQGFYELAKANFQTEVVVGEPFAKVEAPAFLEEVLKATGLEFAVAVGIALRKLQEIE
ncbi:MAG TPA: type IV pilus assembly protein PilM [Candidatus Paceibacterota bacterium]|nr:type IV pilus assembly protein PilM [Candidatus Paceibacterota bacterium]